MHDLTPRLSAPLLLQLPMMICWISPRRKPLKHCLLLITFRSILNSAVVAGEAVVLCLQIQLNWRWLIDKFNKICIQQHAPLVREKGCLYPSLHRFRVIAQISSEKRVSSTAHRSISAADLFLRKHVAYSFHRCYQICKWRSESREHYWWCRHTNFYRRLCVRNSKYMHEASSANCSKNS